MAADEVAVEVGLPSRALLPCAGLGPLGLLNCSGTCVCDVVLQVRVCGEEHSTSLWTPQARP